MALTLRYVANDGTDTYENSTSSSTPSSLATFLANAVAGDVGMIKAGTYTLNAHFTTVNAGSISQPIKLVGCDASWNALNPTYNTYGFIDTSVLPKIDISGGSYVFLPKQFTLFRCMWVYGSYASYISNPARDSAVDSCVIENISDGATAYGVLQNGISSVIYNCDILIPSTAINAVTMSNSSAKCVACRMSGKMIISSSLIGGCVDNIIYMLRDDYGLDYSTASTTYSPLIYKNTIVGGKGLIASSASDQALLAFLNNHITGSSEYGIASGHATGVPIIVAHGRFRDNTSGPTSWPGDWLTAPYVSLTDDDDDTEFVDSAHNDYRLKSTAQGAKAGPHGIDVAAGRSEDEAGGSGAVFASGVIS